MKPISITASVARWLLPIACVALVSATLAWAADRAVAANPVWTQPLAEPPAWAASPTELTGTVVILSSRDPSGSRIDILCRTEAGHSAADALEIEPSELATVVGNLCTWSSVRANLFP